MRPQGLQGSGWFQAGKAGTFGLVAGEYSLDKVFLIAVSSVSGTSHSLRFVNEDALHKYN